MGRQLVRLGFLLTFLLTGLIVHAGNSCASPCAGIPDEQILAYPKPQTVQHYPDEQMLYDRSYARVLDAVDVYDTPSGNVVDHLDAGFNFVTMGASADGWTQIDADKWVQTDKLEPVLPSRYAGVELPPDLPYPIAWILVNVVPSMSPGEAPPEGVLPILRYSVVNIYATVEVDGWNWYQIGIEQWVEQRLVARVLPVDRPADVDTTKWVSVDLYEQVAIAYENNTPVFASLVSSGTARLGDGARFVSRLRPLSPHAHERRTRQARFLLPARSPLDNVL